jgi:spoIIIJ-associated protein
MADYIEKEALSVAEAVFSAARALGIDEKDAQVQVLSAPGARRVKVRVGKPGIQMPEAGALEAAPAEAPREERGERPERNDRNERFEKPVDYQNQASITRTAPSVDQARKAQADLERLLAAMGTPGQVELKDRAGNTVLNIVSPEHESLLIGRRGQTAEALQHLILEFMHHREGDPSLYLVVDVADYHGRAEQRLIEKALAAAEQVKKDGGQVSLGQLSAAERRIVHVTLKPIDGVESFSVGSGSVKKLVVQAK